MQERTAQATKTTSKRPAKSAASPVPNAGDKAGSFQTDTTGKVTGEALQQWLKRELSSIGSLSRYLKKTYEENQRGAVDDSQVATCCLMSDILLEHYACVLQEMQAGEGRLQAVRERPPASGKIYQLASFRRNKAGERGQRKGKD